MKIQKNQKGKYPQIASPHCLTTSPSFSNYKIKALLLSRRCLFLLTVTLPEGKRAVSKYVRNPTTKGNLNISCALFLSSSGYFLVLPKYFPAHLFHFSLSLNPFICFHLSHVFSKPSPLLKPTVLMEFGTMFWISFKILENELVYDSRSFSGFCLVRFINSKLEFSCTRHDLNWLK